MALIFSKINEVFFLAECEKPDESIDLQEIALEFQFTHPQHKFSKSYQMGSWDGEVRFIRFLDRFKEHALVPCGILYEVIEFCMRRKINIQFKDNDLGIRKLDHLDKFDVYLEKIINPTLPKKIEIREYQLNAIKLCLQRQKSVLISPTGSGKSLIIYLFIRWVLDHDFKKDEKFLIVVPNTNLVEQLYNDFISYGYSKPNNMAKIYYGQEKTFDRQIIISTWQSIYKNDYDWFDQFQGLIIDETHRAKADKLTYISENCINARFRLGTTGTLQDDVVERYQSIAYLGKPFRTKTTMELVDEGYLAPFLVKNTILKWKTKDKYTFQSFEEEYSEIINNPKRYKVILNFITQLYSKNKVGTFLVLANRVDTLIKLKEDLDKVFDDVYLIYGDVSVKKREEYLEKVKSNGGIIVANISIMGTGINIPNVSNIVIANPFKSADILAIQTIGRAIRLHPSKKMANIYDFFDKIPVTKHKYNKIYDWLNEKCSVYKREGYQYVNYQYEVDMEN